MDTNTYSKEAIKTAPENLDDNELQMNAVIGLVGESAEILDLYKKFKYQGHPFDKEKVIDELGDTLWYANLLIKALSTTWEEVFDSNIKKLRSRYGEHFNSEKSINRKE